MGVAMAHYVIPGRPNDPALASTQPPPTAGAFPGGGAIDVHSHFYPGRYVSLLRSRDTVPRIVERDGLDRLLILRGEDADASTSGGRPIGSEYWDAARKLAFMDRHGIALSVVSPANPWLDFLPGAEAGEINRDVEAFCRVRKFARKRRRFGLVVGSRGAFGRDFRHPERESAV